MKMEEEFEEIHSRTDKLKKKIKILQLKQKDEQRKLRKKIKVENTKSQSELPSFQSSIGTACKISQRSKKIVKHSNLKRFSTFGRKIMRVKKMRKMQQIFEKFDIK